MFEDSLCRTSRPTAIQDSCSLLGAEASGTVDAMGASRGAWRVVYRGRLTSSIRERLSAVGIVASARSYRHTCEHSQWRYEACHPLRVEARSAAEACARVRELVGEGVGEIVDTPVTSIG
jgi:hypothetical protein